MQATFRKTSLLSAGLLMGLMLATGCQTVVPATGQTLPSPRYLEHPPQFFAPSPAFPLAKELASQERAWSGGNEGAAQAEVMPARVPAAGGAPAPLDAPK